MSWRVEWNKSGWNGSYMLEECGCGLHLVGEWCVWMESGWKVGWERGGGSEIHRVRNDVKMDEYSVDVVGSNASAMRCTQCVGVS
mmetsp:Transcript_8580/g.15524  ORF Transcript_8580/g.15524 Transcript_8580/m.15524 type:complete len:85 (-) Transcript_8580:57-311(-)